MDLRETYLHLLDGGAASEVPVTPTFWQEIQGRADLEEGRMVMRFDFAGDWPTWEVHPHGDEIVVVLAGTMTLHLEGGPSQTLQAGQGALIPRGRWHTADVAEAASALFITPGRGTQNRPR